MISKDLLMIIFLESLGVLGIFGIVYIIKKVTTKNKSLMGKAGIKAIKDGKLPNIQGVPISLDQDEVCCYMDRASADKFDTVTIGHTKGPNGIDVTVTNGTIYYTGKIVYKGILYLTTKRIIYISPDESFAKEINKIIAVFETKRGLTIKFESETYSIETITKSEFIKVYNMVKSTQSKQSNIIRITRCYKIR